MFDYSYGYDKMDNIANKATEDYGDPYRLIAADNSTETDEAFTYATLGNWLTETDTTSIWAFNQNNELAGYVR